MLFVVLFFLIIVQYELATNLQIEARYCNMEFDIIKIPTDVL